MFSTVVFLVLLQTPNVPKELKPWIPWVTYNQQQVNCPMRYNDGAQRFCSMLSPLNLELGKNGGNFSFDLRAFTEVRLMLPTFERGWPQSFQVDRKAHAIQDIGGKPFAILKPGKHTLEGTFAWSQLPHTLSIPEQVPGVNLVLNGQKVDAPNRKEPGKLWLSEPETEKEDEDHVFAQVFCLWQDGNPTRLTTLIQLSISGKVQNWHFPIPMPKEFHLSGVNTALPFQIEGDQLNIQLRPGDWEITLEGLSSQHMKEVEFPSQKAPWPEQELLAFKAEPSIRQVEIKGLQSLDPRRVPIPETWKNNPCYIMDSKLVFEERMRGGERSDIPEVQLNRTLWLDQNGGGFSCSDHLSGILPSAFFFSLEEPLKMGSVTESGENQLITLNEQNQPGIEVRRRSFNLDIESRIPEYSGTLPASGLNTTVKSVQGTLNLPPGWNILFASGPLTFTRTWLSQWNLYDFFIFILLCFSFTKLWDRKTGVLAMVCLFLCYQESDIPSVFWIALVILTALTVYIPAGKLKSFFSFLRKANMIILLFVLFAFTASHLRTGIYPHLKREHHRITYHPGYASVAPMEADESEPMVALEKRKKVASLNIQQNAPIPQKVRLYSENEAVQTGYGLPTWTEGPSFSFSSDAPIYPGQNMRIYLISPAFSLLLTLIQIALLFVLFKALWQLPGRKKASAASLTPSAALVFLFLIPFFTAMPARAQYPDTQLLNELKNRVLKAPDCLPYCAQYQSIDIALNNDQLKLDVLVHAQARTAVPLPGSFSEWLPLTISSRGSDLPAYLAEDGVLWVAVEPGLHSISLQSGLPQKSSFSLSFPMSPHNLNIRAEGWTYETPSNPNQKGSFVRFFKISEKESGPGPSKGDKLAPFFTVKRYLTLNQKWSIHTQIQRNGDSNLSLLLEIPLISGEAVTSKNVQVRDGVATIQIPGNTSTVSWDSALPQADTISLKAIGENWFSEEWYLKYAPIWYVQTTGLAAFSQFDSSGELAPLFKPWPGEELEIRVVKHKPSPGPTSTIDSLKMRADPGRRVSAESLEMSIKTSKGETKTWKLPEHARVKSLIVDGRSIPFNIDQQAIDVPLNPGSHKINLSWEREINLGFAFSSPEIDFGEPTLNNKIEVHFPRNRWIFAVSGPSQGPVILFWSHILFFLLVSFGLSKIPWIPLKFHQWFLLSLGLDQVHISTAFFIYFWIIILGYRHSHDTSKKAWRHNLTQIAMVFMTFFAAVVFLESIRHGLLSYPEMGITGNGSYRSFLAWYQERPEMPDVRVFSFPLWFYRMCMLFWALWMARFLTGKAHWLWESFQKGGLWRRGSLRLKEPRPRRHFFSRHEKTDEDTSSPVEGGS